MSMSAELRNRAANENDDYIPDVEDMEKCLQGNLCRCTGYRPILESYDAFCKGNNRAKKNICLSKEADPEVPREILNGELDQEFLHFENVQVLFSHTLHYFRLSM